jgi:hypothetical protein
MPEVNECLEVAMFVAAHSYSASGLVEEFMSAEGNCAEEDDEEDRALAA